MKYGALSIILLSKLCIRHVHLLYTHLSGIACFCYPKPRCSIQVELGRNAISEIVTAGGGVQEHSSEIDMVQLLHGWSVVTNWPRGWRFLQLSLIRVSTRTGPSDGPTPTSINPHRCRFLCIAPRRRMALQLQLLIWPFVLPDRLRARCAACVMNYWPPSGQRKTVA